MKFVTNRIYPGIGNSRAQDDQYFLDHIILCPRNDEVHDINEAILQQFNSNTEVHMLRSVESVSEEDGIHHAYPAEFLQQLNAGGLPPALLYLKVGSPVILLRSLDPGEGLCNKVFIQASGLACEVCVEVSPLCFLLAAVCEIADSVV